MSTVRIIEEQYIKLKDALHILDLVMSDEGIKHKGKAIRKRLKELPTLNFDALLKMAKELQGDTFGAPLIVRVIEERSAEK